MARRKKGVTQYISAMKGGIFVRSGRRSEKGPWPKIGNRHWQIRKVSLEFLWDNEPEGKADSDAHDLTGNAAEYQT